MDTYETTMRGLLLDETLCRMLKYPAASMSRCMPPVNARLSVDGADVWVSRSHSFFPHFNFSVFLCLLWFKDIM